MGRLKLPWMGRIQTMMAQKGLAQEEWEDEENWQLKIL